MPKVQNARAVGKQRAGAVYVGRPSKWGNPFVMKDNSAAERGRVIDEYRHYLSERPALCEAARRELRGKDLICWCAPRACHADVLIEVANS